MVLVTKEQLATLLPGLLAVLIGLEHRDMAHADDQNSATQVNACAYLADAEIAAALNTHINPGQRHDEGALQSGNYAVPGTYSSTCMWRTHVGQDVGSSTYVILNVIHWPAGSGQARRFLESFRDASEHGEIDQTPLTLDIADGALWWGDGVAAYKGDLSYGVSVHIIGRRERERTIEEVLARKIAPRL